MTQTATQTDREFVINHVHYDIPKAAQRLNEWQLWELYCLADGFGRLSPADLQELNGGYDWSHIRDSSPAAFRQMAAKIRQWLALH